MTAPDLLNSFDVLAVARRWPQADKTALDLASRLSTKADIAAEREKLEMAIPRLRKRERLWLRLAYLGYALVVADALFLALAVFGDVDLVAPILDYVGSLAPKGAALAGALWWLLMLNLSAPSRAERLKLEAALAMLRPVVSAPDYASMTLHIAAGRPEVLAWRDLAIHDREVLFVFDVAVLKALHHASLAARVTSEMATDGVDATPALNGTAQAAATQGACYDA